MKRCHGAVSVTPAMLIKRGKRVLEPLSSDGLLGTPVEGLTGMQVGAMMPPGQPQSNARGRRSRDFEPAASSLRRAALAHACTPRCSLLLSRSTGGSRHARIG